MVLTVSLNEGTLAVRVSALLATPQGAEDEARLRAILQIYSEAADAVTKADNDPELTPLGRKKDAERKVGKADEALKPHDAELERRSHVVEDLWFRAQAIPASGRSDVEALLVEQEIRTALRGVDRLMILPRYLRAIDEGDWDLVRALENAPRQFPLLNDAARKQGAEAKIARSGLADQIAAAEARRDVLKIILNTARAELARLAGRHGVASVRDERGGAGSGAAR